MLLFCPLIGKVRSLSSYSCCVRTVYCNYGTALRLWTVGVGERTVKAHFPDEEELFYVLSAIRISTKFSQTNNLFLVCSLYRQTHDLRTLLMANDIQFQVSYSSASEGCTCFVAYTTIEAKEVVEADPLELLLFEPIPPMLKLDKSVAPLLRSPIDSAFLSTGTPLCISVEFRENVEGAGIGSYLLRRAAKQTDAISELMDMHFPESFVVSRNARTIEHSNEAVRDFMLDGAVPLSHWRKAKETLETEGKRDLTDVCALNELNVVFRKTNMHLTISSSKDSKTVLGKREIALSLQLDNPSVGQSCVAHLIATFVLHGAVNRVSVQKPLALLNNFGRALVQSGVSSREVFSERGLNGSNVVIGVADTGVDEFSCFFYDVEKGIVPRSDGSIPHVDHTRRKIVQYVNFSGSIGDYDSGHGTHVSGTLAGLCSDQGDSVDQERNVYRGMAPAAKLAFFDIGVNDNAKTLIVPDDFEKSLFPFAKAAGARIHSNSWGGGYLYDSYCIETDRFLYENSDFTVFFAAGNDGSHGAETILSPGLSKNAVTVGATQSDRLTGFKDTEIAAFSAHGPTGDGRYKPDIVAPGFIVMSAKSDSENDDKLNCNVGLKSGTSMATPTAAGNAALIIQYFEDESFWQQYCNKAYDSCQDGAFTPSGPLLKALTLHSGERMTAYNGAGSQRTDLGEAPDFYQGYGRMTLTKLLNLETPDTANFTLFVKDGQLFEMTENTYTVSIKSAKYPLRVTISWYDPPNGVFAAKVLLHDLDLMVVSPSGQQFYGNSHSSSGLPTMGASRDEVNTNEQLTIDSPIVGHWKIFVQAKMLTEAAIQKYSIVITADAQVIDEKQLNSIDSNILNKCHQHAGTPSINSELSLDVSLWSKVERSGWKAKDTYTIINIDADEAVVTEGFTFQYDYNVDTICIRPGCYSISTTFTDQSTRGSQVEIAQCAVYLSPVHQKDIFCVDDPVNETVTLYNQTKSEQVIEIFDKKSCSTLCTRQKHITLSLVLSEQGGSGWTGSYYALTTSTALSSSPLQVTNGVGSLEWGFESLKEHCLPARDQCYTMFLSFPDDTEESPILLFAGAKLINIDGSISDEACPYTLNVNNSLAEVCVKTSGHNQIVKFFAPLSTPSDFGQVAVDTSDYVTLTKLTNLIEIGKCTVNATVSEAISSLPAAVTPTVAPTLLPTAVPTSATLYHDHDYQCLKDCSNYPGDDLFGTQPIPTCEFLLNVYYLCDTYALATGACPIPSCASDCSVEDWCYFGAGTSRGCPFKLWQSNDAAVSEVSQSCVSSLTATTDNADDSSPPSTKATPFAIAMIVGQ